MKIHNLKSTRDKRKLLRQSSTEAEKRLWDRLRNKRLRNLKFSRQYGIGQYIADFYCSKVKLVIEVDGEQHSSQEGMAYDEERERFFTALGIKTLRFSNRNVLANIESVINKIQSEIVNRASPSLLKEGERGS